MRTSVIIFFMMMLAPQGVNSQNFDYTLLKSINSKESSFKTGLAKTLSFSAAPVSFGAPLVTFGYGVITKDSIAKRHGLMMAAGLCVNSILTYTIKPLVHRDRPYVVYPDLTKRDHTGPYSFPSGHTSTAFATATSLSLAYPKWYVIGPSFLWAGGVAWSRMYLGVHFPSDILGGIVIGTGSSLLVWWLDKKLIQGK